MGTIENKLNKLLDTKEALKTAITAKGQTISDDDTFASYADKVYAIETGIDTSGATATAADIVYPKTAWVDGELITGEIETRTMSDVTVYKSTVIMPEGYYESSVYGVVPSVEQAVPNITISNTGLVMASVTQGAGYVSSGTKSNTKQLTTQDTKTVTPSTSSQTAVASGVYTTGVITVAGDANLTASNIKSGVTIFGVTGTYVPVFA